MKKFNSLLGPDMESFLELKESLGYSRNTYQYQLGKIDEYAITNHPQLDVMNEAMVLGWASKRKGESNNGRRTRLFTIREFGKYQRGIGKHTYVLTTDYFDKPLNYIPYLFSDEELWQYGQNVSLNILYQLKNLGVMHIYTCLLMVLALPQLKTCSSKILPDIGR